MHMQEYESNFYTSLASCNLLIMLNCNNFLESDEFKNKYFKGSDAWNTQILKQVGIGNLSVMLMILYALIVLPKEQLNNEHSDYLSILDDAIDISCSHYVIDIETNYNGEKNSDLHTINFHDHMRNAISHGRSKLTNKDKIIFTDKIPNTNIQCKLKFYRQDIGLVVEDISKNLTQYLNEKFNN